MNRIGRAFDNLRRFRSSNREWHRDLGEYYGVTPEQALELGSRSRGRRPDLPGSATSEPVSGKSFEEIWESNKRENPEEVHSFYQEMGSWAAFRQVVLHRRNRFRHILRRVEPGSNLCEYGAGVAPLSFCCVETLRRGPASITVTDVAGEHFTFGIWRLNRLAGEMKAPVRIQAVVVKPDGLPLTGTYQTIVILEVFEHLYNPLEVARHLIAHLDRGGYLWENYLVEEEVDGADLQIAQVQRPEVMEILRTELELIQGDDPESPLGGGTRCWRKR